MRQRLFEADGDPKTRHPGETSMRFALAVQVRAKRAAATVLAPIFVTTMGLTALGSVVSPARAADAAVEAAPPPPLRQVEEKAGELRCMIAGGIGFVIAGKRASSCIYYRSDGRVEFYIGSFGKFGLDFGPTQARSAIFEVIAPVPQPIGALDGDFLGLGVGTSIGRGEAGDALAGGRFGTAKIIPIANSRMTGLNLAAGISELHLRYKGTEGRRERYQNNLPEGLD